MLLWIWILKVLGSIGLPIRHTEFKIVDAETGEALPHGSKGIVKVRGPQVMKGYYKVIIASREDSLLIATGRNALMFNEIVW